MAHWRIQSLPYSPPQVLEASLTAASALGLGISQIDRAGGHLYLTRPGWLGRRDRPLDLAVTDSGLGTTLLRVSWEPVPASAWPVAPWGRCAGRLCARTRQILGAGSGR